MRWFLIVLLCSCGWVHAASGLSVETLNFKGKKAFDEPVKAEEIEMPFVVGSKKTVASNINDRLFLDQFRVPFPEQADKFLSSADGVSFDGTESQSFSVSRNDDRVLTIVLSGEGCGAYCENYSVSYNFDVTTGQLLAKEDVFTTAGISALDRQMKQEQLDQYQKQLKTLKLELKNLQKKGGAAHQDEEDDLNQRIELNTECKNNVQEYLNQNTENHFKTYGYEMEFAEKGLNLSAGRCSNHAQRALDDVGDVTLTVPYANLRPALTPYGKTLLLNEGSSKIPSRVYDRILRGHMGNNIAITMLLSKNSDNTVSGIYFYDKYRKSIGIRGQETGSKLVLSEQSNENTDEKNTMELTIIRGTLKGRWLGKKQFDVILAP